LGDNNSENIDIVVNDLNKKTKLQKNTEKLINSSKRLQNAHRMALEAGTFFFIFCKIIKLKLNY